MLFVFTELENVLERLHQGTFRPARPVIETTDTSGEESVISPGENKVLSKITQKRKKAWASDELARLFVTGPTDPVTKPSHFYCQFCRCAVSVLTHGSFEILWHYQGAKHFAIDQWLYLETPG